MAKKTRFNEWKGESHSTSATKTMATGKTKKMCVKTEYVGSEWKGKITPKKSEK